MKTPGRKSKYTDAQRAEVRRLKATGLTIRQIAETLDLPSTFVSETLSPRRTSR